MDPLLMDPLPEPDVIADALNTPRIQSQRIANVGALQNQNNILAAIQALSQQTNQQIQDLGQQLSHDLGQRLDHTNQRIDALGQQLNQRFSTLEHRQYNFEIASTNRHLFLDHGKNVLQQPVDIRNGGNIPGFPLTHTQLYTIDDATADAILPALGIQLPPNTPLGIKQETIGQTRKEVKKKQLGDQDGD
ncbi:hypothetical protein B0T24DRAFT_683561 [Lasiosphaeria ovina]|uniref:Uncharacterized protein n=1 Tax=Lasiosphaeria ovina TaxID=92902 RepID=A0AAE0JV95_9PEZI|nr:hypothetical protein B0T24DRAFT_683561 [Lasiosphaeria ovina]